jgi:hypothetical protein
MFLPKILLILAKEYFVISFRNLGVFGRSGDLRILALIANALEMSGLRVGV